MTFRKFLVDTLKTTDTELLDALHESFHVVLSPSSRVNKVAVDVVYTPCLAFLKTAIKQSVGEDVFQYYPDTCNPKLVWTKVVYFEGMEEWIEKFNKPLSTTEYTPFVAAPALANQRQVGGTHYQLMKVEPWSAMKAWLTREEYIGFLRGNIIKYHARANSGKEDKEIQLKKAGHYQQELEEFLASHPA